jgi:hypothetical protein
MTDDRLLALISDAMDLYAGFDEVYRPHIAEAVLRHLPPEFDRTRLDRLLEEHMPYQM